MCLKIVLALELGHSVPVTFWHMGHTAAGVVSLLDGNCIIKAFPEDAKAGFGFVRRGHLEIVQRLDDGLSIGIKERFFVGSVIEKKPFVMAPCAEVAAKKRQDTVFRFDLAAQHAAQIGEATKAFEQMCFFAQVLHSSGDRD